MTTGSDIWHLTCFGGLRAARSGQTIERFRTQKTASLFALLALRGSQSRDAICALLWPDSAPEAGRASLSAALSALRRDLGNELLVTDRHSVALASGAVSTDVAEFDAALKRRDWTKAIALFRGPLLPGFYEEPFPALAGEYQEKARGAFVMRLEELQSALADGNSLNFDEVRSMARRAILLFGDDEVWFVALMRAHRAADDLDAAIRVYESLQRWGRKQGHVPTEVARQLAKTIRREIEQRSNQIVAPVSEDSTAAEASLNLPPSWTRFFGREFERDMLMSWISGGERLITLSGTGGSGKTRLAVETLRQIAPQWKEHVCFVSLASLTDATLLFSTIRDALHIPVAPDLSPLEQLEQALQGQKWLITLDNFEQLADAGVLALQTLRERLPNVTFLVTSRVVLRLAGEREFPLSPLPTPLQNASASAVTEFPSAALFCDRAGLKVDELNAGAIGALCRRLDGIPLALELAAARAKVMAPSQIIERLESHPNFLQGREFGLPSRHKTLRATIEWSVDLLSPAVRDFFARLSIFHGGWTLEAAEEVCSPGICEEYEAIEFLEMLREHSLLLIEETPLGSRYRLLEMLREWCVTQLDGPTLRELQQRHFEHYFALAQSAQNPKTLAEKLDMFDPEMANFRSALTWALEESEATLAAQLAGALCGFWEMRGHFAEGRAWTQQVWDATAESDVAPCIRARLACGAGSLLWYSGEIERARVFLHEGLRLSGSKCGEAIALEFLARVALIAGDTEEARHYGEEAVVAARQCEDIERLPGALLSAGWGCHNSGDLVGALRYLDECRALGESWGERRLVFLCDATRTFVLQMMGRLKESAALCDQVLKELDESAGLWVVSFTKIIIGQVSLRLNNVERARTLLLQTVRDFHSISTPWEVANALLSCGDVAMVSDEFEQAMLLYGAADALFSHSRCTIVPCLRPLYEENLLRLKTKFDSATFDVLWLRGHNLSTAQAVALTQSLVRTPT